MKDRKDVPISSERYLESDAHTATLGRNRERKSHCFTPCPLYSSIC